MSGWALLWYWVVIVAIYAYFALAIVLAIGGFFDVKTMFRRLAAAALQTIAEKVSSSEPSPSAEPPPPDRGGDS